MRACRRCPEEPKHAAGLPVDSIRTPVGRFGGALAALLAGLPETVPGTTVNRLCGSGMDAVANAARQIKAGEADLVVAGGIESMSRAPFVMSRAETAFSRHAEIHDTAIGWHLALTGGRRALATMCIGVGQGIAIEPA